MIGGTGCTRRQTNFSGLRRVIGRRMPMDQSLPCWAVLAQLASGNQASTSSVGGRSGSGAFALSCTGGGREGLHRWRHVANGRDVAPRLHHTPGSQQGAQRGPDKETHWEKLGRGPRKYEQSDDRPVVSPWLQAACIRVAVAWQAVFQRSRQLEASGLLKKAAVEAPRRRLRSSGRPETATMGLHSRRCQGRALSSCWRGEK